MKRLLSLFLIVGTVFSPVLLNAQEPDEVIRVRSNEVRLDVVVKDKKGHQIRDLKASDFEVLEDGVPQKIESFRFVTREGARAIAEAKEQKSDVVTADTAPIPRRSTPSVTALVFDRLSPEA